MLKRIYFNLVEKYFDIIENGIIQYHYIDTNFDNYSELVSNLVKSSLGYAKKINQKPVFFTGLCLPLYRWFNYSSLPTKLIKKNEIAKVKISSVWYNYLDSIQKLSKDYDVYRCILMIKDSIYYEITSDNTTSFDKEFKSRFKNYNFLPQISYFSQKNELYIIYDGNRPLELFSIKKLKELSLDYSYYDKKIDDENDLFFNIQDKQSCSLPEGFCCEPLGRFFSNNFQDGSKIKVYSFSDSSILNSYMKNNYPEDFFIVGFTGKGLAETNFKYGIVANVSEFQSVRIWFISNNFSPLQPGYEKPEKYFEFEKFVDFLNNNIIKQWYTVLPSLNDLS